MNTAYLTRQSTFQNRRRSTVSRYFLIWIVNSLAMLDAKEQLMIIYSVNSNCKRYELNSLLECIDSEQWALNMYSNNFNLSRFIGPIVLKSCIVGMDWITIACLININYIWIRYLENDCALQNINLLFNYYKRQQ